MTAAFGDETASSMSLVAPTAAPSSQVCWCPPSFNFKIIPLSSTSLSSLSHPAPLITYHRPLHGYCGVFLFPARTPLFPTMLYLNAPGRTKMSKMSAAVSNSVVGGLSLAVRRRSSTTRPLLSEGAVLKALDCSVWALFVCDRLSLS